MRPITVGPVPRGDVDGMDMHIEINRKMHLKPERLPRFFAVCFFVLLAGPAETQTGAVDEYRHISALTRYRSRSSLLLRQCYG